MVDIVDTEYEIDHIKLKEQLNVYSVIPFSAMTHEGMDSLKDSLDNLFNTSNVLTENSIMPIKHELLQSIAPIAQKVESIFHATDSLKNSTALRFLCNLNHIDSISLNSTDSNRLKGSVKESLDSIDNDLKPLLTTLESDLRYGWIDDILIKCS